MDVSLIASVGIDLSKTTFHLVALDCHAKVILRKKFSRAQRLTYTANLPWSIIGMEACSDAHFFAAKLRDQGHEVKLIRLRRIKFVREQFYLAAVAPNLKRLVRFLSMRPEAAVASA
jgi:transposase